MTSRTTTALLLAATAMIGSISTSAAAQAQATKYYARAVLRPPQPVYDGKWSLGARTATGACDPSTKKMQLTFEQVCTGGKCDPGAAPTNVFMADCRLQTCSRPDYYQRAGSGAVLYATTTFPLGTPDPLEATRSWCVSATVKTPICEMEVTSTGYVARSYSTFASLNFSAGPKFAAGLCTPD